MSSIFYLDPLNGLDATTDTPLGWWSLAITAGTGGAPVADEACTGGSSGAHGHLTVYIHASGSWAGNDEAGTLYFYGKTGTFTSETISWAAGSATIAGDTTYCAWKTVNTGATAARTAPGDIIRIAKSQGAISLGNAAWTDKSITVTLAGAASGLINVYNCETTAFTGMTGVISTLSATPTAGGSGYAVNDTFTITGAGILATGKVTAVSGTVVTGVQILTGGSGYTTGTGKATIHTSGSGNDALTVNITAIQSINSSYYTSGRKEGAGSCRVYTNATAIPANTLLAYYNLGGALDLSSYQSLTFWLYIGIVAITAGQVKICLCSDTAGQTIVDAFSISAHPSQKWVPYNLTKNGGGNLGANINSIAIYTDTVTTGLNPNATMYFDNIMASQTNCLNLTSLISKNSLNQGGSEPWLGLRSISGTTLILENGSNNNAGTATRGYSGATDAAVATYFRDPFYVPEGNAPNETGTSSGGGEIQYLGGYDPTTNSCDGETFFSGDGANSGFYITFKDFIIASHLSFVRYSYGINLASGCDAITLSNIQSLNNNFINGFSMSANQYSGPDVFHIINVCNNETGGLVFSANIRDASFSSAITNCNSNTGYGYSCASVNMTLPVITNTNNNGGHGITITGAGCVAEEFTNVNYNAGFGINIGASFTKIYKATVVGNAGGISLGDFSDNYIYNYTSSLNVWNTGSRSILCGAGSHNYIINPSIAETSPIYFTGTTSSQVRIHLIRVDNDPTDNITRVPQESYWRSLATTRTGGTGIMWKMFPYDWPSTETANPFYMPIARIAVASSGKVTVKAWIKKSDATLQQAGLRVKARQITWAEAATTDIYSWTSNDTNWNEVTIEFTPTEAGVVEIEAVCCGQSSSASYFEDMTIYQA